MKKLLVFIIAASMALSLAACTKTQKSQDDIPNEESQTENEQTDQEGNESKEETETPSESEPKEGGLVELLNSGYYITEVRTNLDDIRIVVNGSDGTVIGVGKEWNKELFEKHYDMRNDEDYYNKLAVFMDGLDDVLIKDITNLIPSDEQLSAYEGKTMADIEADGFTLEDASHFETECYFIFTNGLYDLQAVADSFEGDSSEFTHEQDMALTVSYVRFAEFHIDLLK